MSADKSPVTQEIPIAKEIGRLDKQDIIKIFSIKPCVGLRSAPAERIESEVTDGVTFGDYLKITKPDFMNNGKLMFLKNGEELEARLELCKKVGIDPMENEKIREQILDSTNFVDLYNESLKGTIYGFINWTMTKTGLDPSDPEVINKFLSRLPGFELIVPESTYYREAEYMGFEKNGMTIIKNTEIVGMVLLDDSDKKNLLEVASQDGGVADAKITLDVATDFLYEKFLGLIRSKC